MLFPLQCIRCSPCFSEFDHLERCSDSQHSRLSHYNYSECMTSVLHFILSMQLFKDTYVTTKIELNSYIYE